MGYKRLFLWVFLIAFVPPTFLSALRRSMDAPPPPPPPVYATKGGDCFLRFRGLYFLPHNMSHSFQTAPYEGGAVDVRPCWLGEIDFSCMFTKQFGFELAASTSQVKIAGIRTLYGSKIGSTWLLPPTFTLQWRFAPMYLIQPYIGGGANYTWFYSTSCSLPHSSLKLRHSWGPVAQAGIDLFFSEHRQWVFNFDVKYVWINTKATVKTHLDTIIRNSAHVTINPWMFGVGVGRKW